VEEIFIIVPLFLRRDGEKYFAHKKAPVRFTEITRCHSSRSSSSIDLDKKIPALFINIWGFPKMFIVL